MELDYTEQHWGDKKCPKVDCKKDTCKCGLERVFLSAALGDDKKGSPVAPKNGDYCNAIVVYEANNHIYLYSKDGVPTLIELEGDGFEEKLNELEEGLAQEILDRQAADATLQGEIDDIKNSPDVVDIVPTYAALQAYDTSKLGNNDIVRVLQDETHSGESTYYRWNTTTETWTFIGSVGDYYTKGQVDTLLAGKQDTLTAGSNITIENDVISATGTTYTAGTNIQISAQNVISADSQATVFYFDAESGSHGFEVGDIVTLYKDPEATQVASYLDLYNAAINGPVVLAAYWQDTTLPEPTNYIWMTFSVLEVLDDTTGVDPESVTPSLRFTDGGNIYLWIYYTTPNTYRVTTVTPVDRTYSAFVGTDGQTAGTAGLVPAPATTDAGKFLKADGTWDVAGGGGPTVVQTTGTSQTDVMSQKAVTDTLFNSNRKSRVQIGDGAAAMNDYTVAIGQSAYVATTDAIGIGRNAGFGSSGQGAISIGRNSAANGQGSISLGAYSATSSAGEINVGSSDTGYGYSSSNYRLISGVHDPVNAHDAATKGYVDGKVLTGAGAPTTSTVGTVGQIYEDTTNGDLYICTDATNPYVWEQVGAGGSGPTVVQTTGTSQTDVMSQNAVTSMVFADPSNKTRVQIGNSTTFIDGAASNGIVIGANAKNYGDLSLCAGEGAIVNYPKGVCLGARTTANGNFSVALGTGATTSAQGELNIGTGSTYTTSGYNNSNYRLIRGVYDAQGDHDAVTLGQLNGRVKQNAGTPTTSTVGTVGQLLEDTTNGKLYQCTAVDTTDPQNPSYTWTEVGAGGGGGGDTVYSDKSTSSSATGGAVYIGNLDSSQVEQADPTSTDNHYKYFWALPYDNNDLPQGGSINILGQNSGNGAISLGHNAVSRLDNQIAIGSSTLNNYSANNGISIGYNASTRAAYDISIGSGALCNAAQSIAIGRGAQSYQVGSVALGAGAYPTRAGEVCIMSDSTAYGYNNTNYRVIGGVHDGVDVHDAATVGQLAIRPLTASDINITAAESPSGNTAIGLWRLNKGMYYIPPSLTTEVYCALTTNQGSDPCAALPTGNPIMVMVGEDSGYINITLNCPVFIDADGQSTAGCYWRVEIENDGDGAFTALIMQ